MKRKLLKSLLAAPLVLSLATVTFSCQKQPETITRVFFDSNQSVTKNHSTQFIGKTENLEASEVEVSMVNPSSPLVVFDDGFVDVVDDKFTLDFNIDEGVEDNTDFSFDLVIRYTDISGKEKQERFNDFHIFYIAGIDYKEDRVLIEKRMVERVNSHVFNFQVNFTKIPTSDVEISLEDEKTGLLNLTTNIFHPEGELPPSFIVPIELNIGIFETQAIPFNLKLSFTNSYGLDQTIIFTSCVASYRDGHPEEIPEEYYDVVHEQTNEGEKYTIKGIKPGVNPLEVNRYVKMVIPNYVTDIDSEAFTNESWFSSVGKIIIPRSVKNIGLNAFSGLKNITEVDVSSCQDYIPDWMTKCSTEQIKIFNSEKFDDGYIWSNKIADTDEYTQMFINMGLKSKWKAFNTSTIMPHKFFQLSDDRTEIVGFDEKNIDALKDYQVITIPASVTRINEDAFKELSMHPFEKQTANGIERWTRRVIINKNVVELPFGCFADCGIGGTIMIYAEHMTYIAESAFENCCNYDVSVGETNKEPISIDLVNANDLTLIEPFAFNKAYIKQDRLVMPNNMKSIGAFAFSTNRFKSILFSGHETSIGERAFSDTYSYPQGKTINEIDLSNFVYPIPDKEKETFIPDWFTKYDFAFEGAAASEGVVILSKKIHDEIGESKLSDWEKNFKQYHALPSDWTFSYK